MRVVIELLLTDVGVLWQTFRRYCKESQYKRPS